MQRHGNDYIESPVARQSQCKQASQRLRQSLNTAVLKKMDELPQSVFVETEGICGIKSERSAAAQSATAFLVKRRRAAERRAALHAEILRCQRFWFRKTSAANRHSRNFMQRLLANSAVVGKDQSKETVEGLSGKRTRGNIPGRFC